MVGPALFAIAIGAAAAATGCGDFREPGGTLLAALGWPSFREVDAEKAGEAVHDGALLLQARGAERPSRSTPGARLVTLEQPLDADDLGRRIVVVAEEPELAIQLGARLARAGATRVAVVPGGLPAWRTETMEE